MRKINIKINKYSYIFKILFGTVFVVLLLQIFTEIGIIPKNNSLLSFFSLLLLTSIYILYLKFRHDISRREKIICVIGAIFFSSFYVIGNQLNDANTILVESRTLVKIFSFFLLAYFLISILFTNINRVNISHKLNESKALHKFLSKFIYIWIFIFISHIPYLALLNPAALSSDSFYIIAQSIGIFPLNARHPVFYTLLVSGFTRLSAILNIDIYYGILFFSILQMLLMSAVFAFTVFNAYKLKLNPIYTLGMCLFYALFPVFPIYSVTLWKGVLFGGSVLLFTLLLYRSKTEEAFLKSKKNVFFLAASSLAVLLFRTNGIIVIALSLPFILFILKKDIKKVLAALLIPLALYILFITVGYDLLNVKSVRGTEALTVPYQHMARILSEKKELTDEELEFLDKVFLEIDHEYVPRNSDTARVLNADIEYFENNKSEFFENWFSLIKRYPGTLVKSFLNNNYGYWYPGTNYWVVSPGISDKNYNQINIERKMSGDLGNKFVGSIAGSQIFKIFTNTGLGYWAFFFLLLYVSAKKDSSKYILFIPGLALWVSIVIFAPVYAEYRYVYGLFTSLPLITGIVLFGKKNDKNDEILKST